MSVAFVLGLRKDKSKHSKPQLSSPTMALICLGLFHIASGNGAEDTVLVASSTS